MTVVAAEKSLKGDCPQCGADRWARVLAEHSESWARGKTIGGTAYRLFQCQGCDTVYFGTSAWRSHEGATLEADLVTGTCKVSFAETVTYWPARLLRKRPVWLLDQQLALQDEALDRLFGEVYGALNDKHRVLPAIGIRTIFDRAAELLGVDPDLSFAGKLAALETNGKIAVDERRILGTLTDAGSAAAHRGWRPTVDQLMTMMDIIEAFIHRNFILKHAADRIRDSMPVRPPRRSR
jgi:hypothetical protein